MSYRKICRMYNASIIYKPFHALHKEYMYKAFAALLEKYKYMYNAYGTLLEEYMYMINGFHALHKEYMYKALAALS